VTFEKTTLRPNQVRITRAQNRFSTEVYDPETMITHTASWCTDPHIDTVNTLSAKAACDGAFPTVVTGRGIASIGSLEAFSHHEFRGVESRGNTSFINVLVEVTE
jgi:hypothetical protein